MGPPAPTGTGTKLVLDTPPHPDMGWPCLQLLVWGQVRGVPEGPRGGGLGLWPALGCGMLGTLPPSLRGVISSGASPHALAVPREPNPVPCL